jgi:methylaspartate mutase sigma subunit
LPHGKEKKILVGQFGRTGGIYRAGETRRWQRKTAAASWQRLTGLTRLKNNYFLGRYSMEYKLVTGVIGEDVHNIGIKVLEHAFKREGFKVVSLGIRVSPEDFINAAVETKADGIMISSLSGHAEVLVEGFRDKCTEAGLGNILIYIGGHLFIGDDKWSDMEKRFKDKGFDRVYPASTLPGEVIAALKEDFAKRGLK